MKVLIFIMLGLIWKEQLTTAMTEKCSKEENKTYYIYSQINVQVYYCVVTNDSCEDVGVGETLFDNHLAIDCISKLYNDGLAYNHIYPKSHGYLYDYAPIGPFFFTVCTNGGQFEFTHVDKNRYPVSTEFWIADDCKHLELIYASTWSERDINSKKYITSSRNNYIVAMALEQQISLCGRLLWTTNTPGILASDGYMGGLIEDSSKIDQYQNEFQKVHATIIESECELDIKTENRAGTAVNDKGVGTSTVQIPKSDCTYFQCEVTSKFSVEQDSEIDTRMPCPEELIAALRTQLYCIICIAIICVLWLCISSAVGMYINFLTLRRAAKKLPNRSRMYIMNCVSQSLTNRWLFLNKNPGWDERGIPLDVTRDSDNHNLYESVD